jgi:hypothetical protein
MKQFKIYILLLISVLAYSSVQSQTPEKMNYQAVVRDLAGLPLSNQGITVVFEVRQASASGLVVYSESQGLTTNQFGLFTAEIGGGTVLSGNFSTITWGSNSYYLYVEVDGTPIGASQLLSVPYALYSKESLNGPTGAQGPPGLGINWLGTLASNPATPSLNDAYYNSTLGQSFIWDGSAWQILAQDGTAGGFSAGTGIDLTGGVISNTGDLDSTNEFQNLSINGNNIDISNGTGTTISATAPLIGDYLYWNGLNWVAQTVTGDNWGSDVVNVSGTNISGDGTIGNPLIVTDAVNDADADSTNEIQTISSAGGVVTLSNGGGSFVDDVNDADNDPNNERITTFALNATNDSIIIVESGVGHAMPLSNLSDGDWTKGVGNDIFNLSDSVGIGTNNPKSPLQIGDKMHLFPFNLAGEEYSIFSYNAHWDGTTVRNTAGGFSGVAILGDQGGTPLFGVQIFPSQPAGSDVMSASPIVRMNLNNKGLAINSDNADAGLEIQSIDSATILLEVPDDFSLPTILFADQGGDYLGLRGPSILSSGSFSLTLPMGLPAIGGSALVSDVSGNLSWNTPPTALWTGSAGAIYPTTITDKVGVGLTNPSALLHLNGTLRLENMSATAPAIGSVLTSMDAQGNAEWQPPVMTTTYWALSGSDIFNSNVGNVGVGVTTNFNPGNYQITASSSATKTLTVTADPDGVVADGFSSLVLEGSSITPGNEVGIIDFVNTNTSASRYNFARIAATAQNSNPTYAALRFYTRFGAALTEKMIINEFGSVGVGISTPEGLMHLRNGSGTQLILGHANQPTAEWILDSDASGKFNLISEDFGTARTVLTSTNLGRVGIGTTTPFNVLDVEGAMAIGSNYSGGVTAPTDGLIVQGNVGIGSVSPGMIAGSTNYLTIASTGPYAAGSIASIELKGNTNSANSTAAKIDFLNGLGVNNIARIETMTSGGSTGEGRMLFYTNGGALTEKMRIDEDGNVGIATTSPTALLSVNGAANKPGGGTWAVFSDVRSKENVIDYKRGLNELLKLRPVSFNYKSEFKWGDKTYVGLIAQEVEKVVPTMVEQKEVNGIKDFREVDPNEINYMLINAVKEQQKMIEDLKLNQQKLEQEIQQLKNK